MAEYYFCKAKKRPAHCKLTTNLCCMVCQFNEECTAQAKQMKLKVIPCAPNGAEDEEEFCDDSI